MNIFMQDPPCRYPSPSDDEK